MSIILDKKVALQTNLCSYSREIYASAARKIKEESSAKVLAAMENVSSNWI